jgi:uncharacterized peroxidase-related enzyme
LKARKVDEETQNELLATLSSDHGEAEIPAADRAMLDYVLKLTHTPGKMVEADADSLRNHGFDDRGIHDICSIAAYFAFVNRIADGLGVEMED